ncbi:hypothetical protein AXFE_22290 [Acidithrix ferrooxidans]|uniref:Uncharacterized protein n=1 Tax=Acidithrix ferrooxidans TaxID=1280514 RepID=A0A0D8HIQ2_9ACTN|nr:hypothetical protein AXFE_22290 [Acidithrix ferrooxidans]
MFGIVRSCAISSTILILTVVKENLPNHSNCFVECLYPDAKLTRDGNPGYGACAQRTWIRGFDYPIKGRYVKYNI